MRERAQIPLVEASTAGTSHLDYEAALLRRVRALEPSRRPLLYGRIDEEGTRWQIGRRSVEDHRCAPVVIDWRAPVVVPFRQARPESPAGLRRRRQVMVEAATVIALADDLVGALAGGLMITRLRGGDVLQDELERRQSGEMLENVATIEAEQDEVIRALSVSCVLSRESLVPLRPLSGSPWRVPAR